MLPNWLSSLWGVLPGKSLVVTAKPRTGLPGARELAPVKLPQEEFLRCSQPNQLSGRSRVGSEGGSRGCCGKASERQAGWGPTASRPAFCSHRPPAHSWSCLPCPPHSPHHTSKAGHWFPHLKKVFDIYSKSEGVVSTEGLEVKCALCPKMHETGS